MKRGKEEVQDDNLGDDLSSIILTMERTGLEGGEVAVQQAESAGAVADVRKCGLDVGTTIRQLKALAGVVVARIASLENIQSENEKTSGGAGGGVPSISQSIPTAQAPSVTKTNFNQVSLALRVKILTEVQRFSLMRELYGRKESKILSKTTSTSLRTCWGGGEEVEGW